MSRIDPILPQSYLGKERPEIADKVKPEDVDPAAGISAQEGIIAPAETIIPKIRADNIEIHFQLIVYITPTRFYHLNV